MAFDAETAIQLHSALSAVALKALSIGGVREREGKRKREKKRERESVFRRKKGRLIFCFLLANFLFLSEFLLP